MPPDQSWMSLAARLRRAVDVGAPLEAALGLAVAAHATATRDEGTPYVEHPLRVALILVEELGVSDPDSIMAALLHDVLEDSSRFGPADIARICPDGVLDLVTALTRGADAGAPHRRESRITYLQRFATAPDPVLVLKLSDRLDNLRSLPDSPSADKRRRYVEETTTYLLPLCEGRGGPIAVLHDLIRQALEDVRVPDPSRTVGP